jgi:hypothetical protein
MVGTRSFEKIRDLKNQPSPLPAGRVRKEGGYFTSSWGGLSEEFLNPGVAGRESWGISIGIRPKIE